MDPVTVATAMLGLVERHIGKFHNCVCRKILAATRLAPDAPATEQPDAASTLLDR